METPSDNPRMENAITRLRDCYSFGLVRRDKRLLVNDHHGICIDIFPIRECSNDSRLARWLLRRLASNYGWYLRSRYNKVCILSLLNFWYRGAVLSLNRILFWLTQVGRRPKFFVESSWFLNEHLWWPQEWLMAPGKPSREVLFDGEMMPIPLEAEKILTEYFGDWRKMPPVDSRIGYLSVCLPITPCFHPMAMRYPDKEHE